MGSIAILRMGAALACCAAVLGASGCRPGGAAQGQAVDRVSTEPSATASTSASSSAFAGSSAKRIADRSLATMKHLKSLTIKADLTGKDGRMRATLSVGGRACRMRATVPGMGTFTYIRTRRTSVIRLDKKRLRAIAGPDGTKLLAGRYLKVPTNAADFKDMASMCKASYYTSRLGGEAEGVTFERAGTATVAGVPAVVLTATGKGEKSRIYVAASGKPYLLKVTGHDREERGTVGFTDFDHAPAVHLPPASKTIDISKLNG